MTDHVLWLLQLSENVLCKDLAELNTHLICTEKSVTMYETGQISTDSPNELMPQMTPCVKILCS